MTTSSSNKMIALSGFLFIILSFVATYFWKRNYTIEYLLDLFSVENILEDVIYGVVGSFFLLLLLSTLVLTKKNNLPNTGGSRMLVGLLKESGSALYLISTLTVLGEELLFRGVLLMLFITFMPPWLGITLISFIFLSLHYKDQYEGQPYLLIYLFIMSVLTGLVTVEQSTLWSAVIIHATSNFASSLLIKKNIIKLSST